MMGMVTKIRWKAKRRRTSWGRYLMPGQTKAEKDVPKYEEKMSTKNFTKVSDRKNKMFMTSRGMARQKRKQSQFMQITGL